MAYSESVAKTTGISTYEGHIVDIPNKKVFPGRINVENGIISSIDTLESVSDNAPYFMPGMTDAHIHIESTMLTPVNFSKIAVAHGVVNSVSDPHEIANVLGVEGIDYMIENAKSTRFNCYFGVPACVPSSPLETAGAHIDATMTAQLIQRPDLWYLAEMMDYPGVINDSTEVLGKINATLAAGKVVDGHAPGVAGDNLAKYHSAGITTDHECSTMQDAQDRMALGMKIIIREGSAARNLEALFDVLSSYPEMAMFCSDDKHPDDLIEGHIDAMVRRGLAKDIPIWNLLTGACINPINHYRLPAALMRPGDKATFISVDNLTDFRIQSTIIDGLEVYNCLTGVNIDNLITSTPANEHPNNFNASPISVPDLKVNISAPAVRVIEVTDGELLTRSLRMPVDELEKSDVCKIVVYSRYGGGKPQIGYIKGFGLKGGAIGASIAHDAHNIVAIGDNDDDICSVINRIIDTKGGIGVSGHGCVDILPLPIAGLMSDKTGEEVATSYKRLDAKAKTLGCTLHSPFITMAFMTLPVIPELKITDKGLIDVGLADFTSVSVD